MSDAEQRIHAFAREGDWDRAAEALIRAYGGEIFGFLLAMHRDEDDASDAFSAFSERVWKGLRSFAWESSARSWAYVVARNASHTQRARASKRAARERPLGSSAIDAVAAEVRTATLSLYRTEKRSAIAELREELPEEDRMLLVLRVDRGLAWEELARVFADGDVDVARESARLRKRFQLVKAKLVSLAKARGLR